MKAEKIIKAMNDYVVEMTEERAKKARKMIEGKGMKVDEKHWEVGDNDRRRFLFYYRNTWVIDYLTNEQLMPWKQFKSMFQEKKSETVSIHIDVNKIFEKYYDVNSDGLVKHFENPLVNDEKTDTAKPETRTDFEKLDPIVRDLMLFEQVRQGNEKNEEAFKETPIRGFKNGGFQWPESIIGSVNWDRVLMYKKDPQPLIEAYKEKASEHPELMDIFSRFAPLEHIVESNEVIDWSKPLQVVEGEYSIVLTSGNQNHFKFSGMCIKQKDKVRGHKPGVYSSSWEKELFKLCKDQTIKF